MPFEIETRSHPDDFIPWLQERVGDLLWSRPVVEWKGKGWTVNAFGAVRPSSLSSSFIIRINDPKLATLAALRWQS